MRLTDFAFLTIRQMRSKTLVETRIEHADFSAMKTFTLRAAIC